MRSLQFFISPPSETYAMYLLLRPPMRTNISMLFDSGRIIDNNSLLWEAQWPPHLGFLSKCSSA